jgi:hypothetical protein
LDSFEVFKKSRKNNRLRKDTAKHRKTDPSIVQKRSKAPCAATMSDPNEVQYSQPSAGH